MLSMEVSQTRLIHRFFIVFIDTFQRLFKGAKTGVSVWGGARLGSVNSFFKKASPGLQFLVLAEIAALMIITPGVKLNRGPGLSGPRPGFSAEWPDLQVQKTVAAKGLTSLNSQRVSKQRLEAPRVKLLKKSLKTSLPSTRIVETYSAVNPLYAHNKSKKPLRQQKNSRTRFGSFTCQRFKNLIKKI